jgi:Sec-independent protein translocase protein TatA
VARSLGKGLVEFKRGVKGIEEEDQEQESTTKPKQKP